MGRRLWKGDSGNEIVERRMLKGDCGKEIAGSRLRKGHCGKKIAEMRLRKGDWGKKLERNKRTDLEKYLGTRKTAKGACNRKESVGKEVGLKKKWKESK